jgi:hypothetical protein
LIVQERKREVGNKVVKLKGLQLMKDATIPEPEPATLEILAVDG